MSFRYACAAFALVLGVGCAADDLSSPDGPELGAPDPASSNDQALVSVTPHRHLEDDGCSGAVNWNGGPVVSNARVTSVIWNYASDPSGAAGLPGFYRDILRSPFMDFLSEYETASLGGSQTIGRGSFLETDTITPHNGGATLSDGDMQSELAWQIDHGHLHAPNPDNNDIYAVLMPSGYCAGDICEPMIGGYHGSFSHYGAIVRYIVLAEFDTAGRLPSHELAETITDPDDFTGWVLGTLDQCEIADVCEDHQTVRMHMPEIPDKSYMVQPIWSITSHQCIVQHLPNKSDILWRDSNTTLQIWFMNAGSIVATGTPSVTRGSDIQVETTGDFDGDGESDILWRDGSNVASMWLMQGSAIELSGDVADVPTPTSQFAGTGDFDGDGRSDILWRDSSTGALTLWYMAGFDIQTTSTRSGLGSGWQIQGIGDFNGDTLSDILWRNTSTGALYGWFSVNGVPISTSAPLATTPGLDWQVNGIGDFNGDGDSDILWRDSNGQVAIWLMSGATISYQIYPSTVPGLDWQIRGVGDFDGDGNSDILWRDSNGQVAIWFMSSATILSTAYPGIPGNDWVIQSVGAF